MNDFLKEGFTWDDIMALVEKIEKDGHPVYIHGNNCTIYEKVGKDHGWMMDHYGKDKISATVEAVSTYFKAENLNLI